MTMPSSCQKNDETLLARGDIMGLAKPGAALMPGSMTLVPSNASLGLEQLMMYLRSRMELSCKPLAH